MGSQEEKETHIIIHLVPIDPIGKQGKARNSVEPHHRALSFFFVVELKHWQAAPKMGITVCKNNLGSSNDNMKLNP
jgi:hypothetical protein